MLKCPKDGIGHEFGSDFVWNSAFITLDMSPLMSRTEFEG